MKKNDLNSHQLYKVWSQVPVSYYQDGVKKNLFQKMWHASKIRLAKKLLSRLEFRNCLDVGCASGYMVSEVAKAFPSSQYMGIDIYDKAIEYARRTYPSIKFKVASADKLPFKDSSFDLILFYETIEHVEDPAMCLKEIRRVLSRNGTLILTMDSGNWLFRIAWFVWENSSGKIWKGAHLHPFHHTQLERIIKKARFKIKSKIFTFFGMEVTFVLKK